MEITETKRRNKHYRLFKFSVLTFLFFILQQHVAFSQSITLSLQNETIKTAFNAIEKQINMSIDYDESVLNVNKRINVNISGKPLSEVMKLVLQDTQCTYVVKNKHIVITSVLEKEEQKGFTISGIVSDSKTFETSRVLILLLKAVAVSVLLRMTTGNLYWKWMSLHRQFCYFHLLVTLCRKFLLITVQ